MANDYKYDYQEALYNPDYAAAAHGTDINDAEFGICVFPNTNEDIHVTIPVLPMVDNLIEDYVDEAKPILQNFLNALKERIEKI